MAHPSVRIAFLLAGLAACPAPSKPPVDPDAVDVAAETDAPAQAEPEETPEPLADAASPDAEPAPETAPSPEALAETAPPACAVAKFEVKPGLVVVPQTTLTLVGSGSTAAGGVSKYVWGVTQPAGAASAFEPASEIAEPTFSADVVGDYTFTLQVFDAAGAPGCEDASATVTVLPEAALHVELLWSTAADTDLHDGAGADVDLHLLHPKAAGPDLDQDGAPDGWFDPVYDCHAENPTPAWGMANPVIADDPLLSRADDDGAGPEIARLGEPEEGALYTIGAHYRDAHGLGPSKVTLRIYVLGVPTYQSPPVELEALDMWRAATVEWPSGKVKPLTLGGQPHITPDYPAPTP